MNSVIERLFYLLTVLRDGSSTESCQAAARVDGYLECLFWSEKITLEQLHILSGLCLSAFLCVRKPLPSPMNAGPMMPSWVAHERAKQLPKPQAQVQANEKPESVSAPAAPRKLLLLCLLGRSPGSVVTRAFAQPVAVSGLRAPWAVASARWRLRLSNRPSKRSAVSGIWPIQGCPGLVLREAHAVAPSPEVLARLQRHGQADAFCATARTLRTGVTG